MSAENLEHYAPAEYWNRTIRGYINAGGYFGYWGGRLVDNFLTKVPAATRTVLELGCGGGQDARRLSDAGFEVTAMDLSSEAVDYARRSHPDAAITWVVGDMATPLPFDDAQFDMVVSNQALHMFPHTVTVRVFEEIARVIRPGGLLAFHVNSLKDRPHRHGYKPAARELESDFVIESDGQTMHFFSGEYVHSLLKGWSEISLRDVQAEVHDNGVHEKWMFCVTALAPRGDETAQAD